MASEYLCISNNWWWQNIGGLPLVLYEPFKYACDDCRSFFSFIIYEALVIWFKMFPLMTSGVIWVMPNIRCKSSLLVSFSTLPQWKNYLFRIIIKWIWIHCDTYLPHTLSKQTKQIYREQKQNLHKIQIIEEFSSNLTSKFRTKMKWCYVVK